MTSDFGRRTSDDRDLDPGEYCRQVEAYLCRKNDGHLIRISGPSFMRVCGWARQGIPLNAVYRGIDRYFERYYAKGVRRRPVHVDFCEGDVLTVFDEWRRAVGVPVTTGTAPTDSEPSEAHRHTSLPVHLERVVARLTSMRAGGRLSAGTAQTIDLAVREIDALRGAAAYARGEARAGIIERLSALDDTLVASVRAQSDAEQWQALEDEARGDLARFKGAMAPDAHERAVLASATRLLRERTGLPDVKYHDA